MDEIKKEDAEKVTQSGFNSLGEKDNSWLPVMALLMLAFSGKNNSISKDEHIKMKEDIAELKGKMSMLEKMM